jgi:hypothetical protein
VAVGHRVVSGECDLADGVATADLAPGLGVPGWRGGLAYDRPRRPRRTGAAAHPRLPRWPSRAGHHGPPGTSGSRRATRIATSPSKTWMRACSSTGTTRAAGSTGPPDATPAPSPTGPGRRRGASRPGVGLRVPHPAAAADRRPRGVLQRAGRRERRRRAPAAADDALLPIGAVAHSGSARRELVLGDRVLEVVRERVRAPRPDVGEDRVVEALLELRAHRLAVGDRQQHR